MRLPEMRILHVISSADPAGGGPIETVIQLGELANSAGHHVEVVTLDTPDAPYHRSFPLPVHALGPCRFQYGYTSRFVPWLRANADKFDVVVVNGIWQYHSFGTRRALRASSTPYVVFTHGMLDPWFKRTYPLKHLKKWIYWPWGEYRVLRDAAAVLFTCDEERVLARRSFWLYKANEVVVTLGTATPDNDRESQMHAFVSRFPETRGKHLILFMGRIHPKKGCDLVLQAFADVFAGNHDWQLVIAGPDQVGWRPELDRLATQLRIADQITWTGFIAGDCKWGLMRSAETLFLPSHQENFGVVVAEALACGLPTLISDKVNIWREVHSDRAGLVAADDLQGAISLLRRWVDLPSDAKSAMRVCARRSFEERFEIEKASSLLISVLRASVRTRQYAST